jgi:pimeloyl-ACP methyl ester carboxylesterase
VQVPSSDGVVLQVHDLGGDGPPLLVAHATGFNAGAYRPMARRLADRFHVWAFDFRGHGESTRPTDGDFAWSGMIDDVLAVVDHLAAEGVATGPLPAFGHSMGGACLLGAEIRRPGTFASLSVFEPIVVPTEFAGFDAGGNPLAASARRRRATFPSKPEVLARYAGRPPLGVFRADALWHYVDAGFAATAPDAEEPGVTLRCAPEDEAATFEGANKPTSDQLAAVTVPVTYCVGGRDVGPGPAQFAPFALRVLPDGRLREYPHLGHFGPFQDPDLVADDLAADLVGDLADS